MGSAFKNKGVQALLDGVNKYLPAPTDITNVALDVTDVDKNDKASAENAPEVVLDSKEKKTTPFIQTL